MYPGLKTTISKVDFRVHLARGLNAHVLSHVDIIVDLYWKARYRLDAIAGLNLLEWLDQLFEHGPMAIQAVCDYKAVDIDDVLRRSIKSKTSMWQPMRRELTFEELAASACWIALQEDINYPAPRYYGRALPCIVYAEAVHAASRDTHFSLLNRTIQRAEQHRPRIEPLPGVQYPGFVASRLRHTSEVSSAL